MSNKPAILVVDDVDHQRKLYELIADKVGFVATIVGSSRAALKAIESEHFDLIVMDWMLPDMDGLGACRKSVLTAILLT